MSETGWVTHQYIRSVRGDDWGVGRRLDSPRTGGVLPGVVSFCRSFGSRFGLGSGGLTLPTTSSNRCTLASMQSGASVSRVWWHRVGLALAADDDGVGSEKMHPNRMRLLGCGGGGWPLTPSACWDGW